MSYSPTIYKLVGIIPLSTRRCNMIKNHNSRRVRCSWAVYYEVTYQPAIHGSAGALSPSRIQYTLVADWQMPRVETRGPKIGSNVTKQIKPKVYLSVSWPVPDPPYRWVCDPSRYGFVKTCTPVAFTSLSNDLPIMMSPTTIKLVLSCLWYRNASVNTNMFFRL